MESSKITSKQPVRDTMFYLTYLKSAKTNLYRQMVHFDCIVTLGKSDRKEGKNLAFNGKESHFTFFCCPWEHF